MLINPTAKTQRTTLQRVWLFGNRGRGGRLTSKDNVCSWAEDRKGEKSRIYKKRLTCQMLISSLPWKLVGAALLLLLTASSGWKQGRWGAKSCSRHAYVNGIFEFIVRLCLFCFLHTAGRKILQTGSQASVRGACSSNTHSNSIHHYSLHFTV